LCEELAEKGGIELRFTHRQLPNALAKDIAACLYRVTQEALHNISKHANAQKGAVSVTGFPDYVRLSIRDSGIGFDPARTKTGLGLVSMEERVRLVNGHISVASQPGKGTTITVRVPLSGAAG
jgi:signal transduction histidine kinase